MDLRSNSAADPGQLCDTIAQEHTQPKLAEVLSNPLKGINQLMSGLSIYTHTK